MTDEANFDSVDSLIKAGYRPLRPDEPYFCSAKNIKDINITSFVNCDGHVIFFADDRVSEGVPDDYEPPLAVTRR